MVNGIKTSVPPHGLNKGHKEPKINNILRKNQNGFRRNRSMTSQILTIRGILEGIWAKNLQTTLLFVDFTKAFDSIDRRKMEQILLANGLSKETVAAITILYRNTKVKVRSPDGDRILRHCSKSTTRGHASPILLYHLSRLRAYNFDGQNQRKWLRADKEKKQKVPRKNNYRRRLCRRHTITGKYTQPSRNTTA